MTVQNVLVGRVTPTAARVRVTTDADLETELYLLVDVDPALPSPVRFGPATPDGLGVVTLNATGLENDTQYHYAVEEGGVTDTAYPGGFRTHPQPGSPASFTFAASGDAGGVAEVTGVGSGLIDPAKVSNHPVFRTIQDHAADPLFFLHLGDLHYYNLGTGGDWPGTLANYRQSYDDILQQPRQHELYRNVPLVLTWDDHDYGPNNADGTHPEKDNAAQAYRERVPSYNLPDADGAIYHSFQVGRVLFVVWDVRYHRSPDTDTDGPSKTMLGSAQKSWMRSLLETTNAEALVVVSAVHWILDTADNDSWGAFATERQEIADMLVELDWADRMVMLCADRHATMLDSGANNAWGGFPTYGFSALDATPHSGPWPHDVGSSVDRNQYGILAVTDDGSSVRIKADGYNGGTVVLTHSVEFSTTAEGGGGGEVPDATAGAETPQQVAYSYWPVNYLNGDPHVISNRPLPLSGVAFSSQGRDVGQMRAAIQLADSDVRALNPWDKLIPRETGIVVVRTVTTGGVRNHNAVWHGILWEAPADPASGRLNLMFETVESLWARRRITGPPPLGFRKPSGELRPGVRWDDADQAQIVRDLLNPNVWSQFGLLPVRGGLALHRTVTTGDAADGGSYGHTGDLEITADISPDSWQPDVPHVIASQYEPTDGLRAWQLWLDPGGTLRLRWSEDGTFTNAHDVRSIADVSHNNRRLTVQVYLDVDNGSSQHEVEFSTASDPGGSFTPLGAVVTGSGVTAVHDSTKALRVGNGFIGDEGVPFEGTIHSVTVRHGVNAGTIAANPDFGIQSPGTTQFTDGVGNTWTLTDAEIVPGYPFPGWINVDSPEANMGVPRDMAYRRGQATPLLRAHQDRSKIINGYEWYTRVKVLEGENAYAATSFRLEFVWGYPRLGKVYGIDRIPRFSYYVDGRGNVITYGPVYDGTSVSNIVWGSGSGYDAETVRFEAWNSRDWVNGFLVTEGEYNNPDVSRHSTLREQTEARMIQGYADERFVDRLIVRGDLLPHFGTYEIGDDCLVTTDDWTWPDNPDGTRGVTFVARILGWTVTPPEGDQAEHVDIMVGGQEVVS